MKELIRLMADGLVIPIVVSAFWALWWKVPRSQKSRAYSLVIVAGLTTYLLAKLIAAVWQPDVARPFEQMGKTAGALYLQNAGFPSDHALFCAFLTLSVWFLTRRKRLSVAMGVMTLLVCLGRVLALVHTPLDVVGGVVIATLGTVWYWQYRPPSMQKAYSKSDYSQKSKTIVK